MPTVIVKRAIASDDVAAALKERLGARYTVEPTTRRPNVLRVETSSLSTCRVRVEPVGTTTALHVHGGGLMIGRIVNEFGIAMQVAKALREAKLDTPSAS